MTMPNGEKQQDRFGIWKESKARWQKQLDEQQRLSQIPVEPRGFTPLAEIPRGESIWETMWNQIAGRLLSSGGVQDPTTGKLIPITQAQFMGTVTDQ